LNFTFIIDNPNLEYSISSSPFAFSDEFKAACKNQHNVWYRENKSGRISGIVENTTLLGAALAIGQMFDPYLTDKMDPKLLPENEIMARVKKLGLEVVQKNVEGYWGEDGRCIHCGAGNDANHSFSCPTNMHPDKMS
jgi:hypothetical protein